MEYDVDLAIDKWKNIFGAQLTTALKYRGVQQKEIAKFLNKNENTISLWRSRGGNPSLYSAKALAQYLDFEFDFFLNPKMSIDDADLLTSDNESKKYYNTVKNILFSNLSELSEKQQKLADKIVKMKPDEIEKVEQILNVIGLNNDN